MPTATDADPLTPVDPGGEEYDELDDAPLEPGEEVDPDSLKIDPEQDEGVYEDEDEYRREPL